MRMRKLERLLVLGLMSLVSCNAAPDEPAEPDVPRPPATLGRWTSAFLERGLLIADEITIEGPPALRDHLVMPQDAVGSSSSTRATDEGLLQIVEAKPEGGAAEIRAYLDNWEIVATKSLRVLERPAEIDVELVARGDAAFHPLGETAPTDGSGARRGAELSFQGELDR